MGWQDLIQQAERISLPWVGGRQLRTSSRSFRLQGRTPNEVGWYEFEISGGRDAKLRGPADPNPESLGRRVTGYLVGDRLVPDGIATHIEISKLYEAAQTVFGIEDGVDRFARISAGSTHEGGPLFFIQQEMPLGPEPEVLNAFLDKATALAEIKGVTPGLDVAFRMESWQRDEAERRRLELERLRREEEERRIREERRRQIAEQIGTGAGRREMAKIDFAEAAKAALAISGAELLDDRRGARRDEHVVRFRFLRRRFECVCDDRLQIIDSGICLRDHDTGEAGDTWLTLESLPGVIQEAYETDRLVVFRHAD